MSEQSLEDGTVGSDLCALLESGEGADVTLVVGETELQVHSQILAARSPVFAAALRHDMLETSSRSIKISDMQEEVLKELLQFIYGDKTPRLRSVAAELLTAADRYDLPLLKTRCEQQIARDLSVENAAATAALAVQYSCSWLLTATAEFIADHPEVMATAGWEQVLRDNVDTALEISRELAVTPFRLRPETVFAEALKREFASRLMEALRNGGLQEVGALLGRIFPRDEIESSSLDDQTDDDGHQHTCHHHHHWEMPPDLRRPVNRRVPEQQKAGRQCCCLQ